MRSAFVSGERCATRYDDRVTSACTRLLAVLPFALSCGGGSGSSDASTTDSSAEAGPSSAPDDDGSSAPGDDAPATTDASTTTGSATLATTDDGGESTGPPPGGPGGSLQFFGNGGTYDDRVLVRIDDPTSEAAGPAVDVGGDDFTIELWLRPDPAANGNTIECGAGFSWVGSNIVVDRDRHSQSPSFGLGIAGGAIAFAVSGPDGDAMTLCGTADVLDDAWHHVAVQRRRSDGEMQIWVDGELDAAVDGPDGDVSYPDDGVPLDVCPGGSCDYSDPFLSIGAEKHGYGGISYAGLADELRISAILRYDAAFPPPDAPFDVDGSTAGLYHFDEGRGIDARNATGGVDGELRYGGDPPGPQWSDDTPFR
jgi:hypothetical protein